MKLFKDVYWTAFSKDTRFLQAFIYSVYLLETTQTILLTHDAFQAFVFGFMDPASMDDFHNLWLDAYFFDGLVALLVQLCYANRIRTLLSRFKVIPGIIALLSITQFACAISTSISFRNFRFSGVHGKMSAFPVELIISYLWVGCSLAADIIIAVTMVYALSRYDTTAKETRNLVSRLSRLVMETGSLVALTHMCQPLFYNLYPDMNYFMTPVLVTAKLYSNSMLAFFNSRVRIQGARGTGYSRTERINWRTSIRVTTSHDAAVPFSTLQSRMNSGRWVADTSPGSLNDMDSSGSATNNLETKTEIQSTGPISVESR
ncbi:hypothetical protein Moror_9353 [Moniliophthora roreri MCA 2997]|uniref:DUF6534 domain-containing protein n=1 Tax=Moniliophthora roreri (strain MCA 2997) TaxID=1381753 RepID=V2WZY1_MONRO|nr:hypothetical protein Moror_9353 [Moniliophthora roreri MCA 2997]